MTVIGEAGEMTACPGGPPSVIPAVYRSILTCETRYLRLGNVLTEIVDAPTTAIGVRICTRAKVVTRIVGTFIERIASVKGVVAVASGDQTTHTCDDVCQSVQ